MSNFSVSGIAKARTPLRFILAVTRPFVGYAFFAVCFVIGAAFLDTFGSYVFKKIVDTITLGGRADIATVWFWAGVYVFGIVFLQTMLWRASGFLGMRWSVGIRATATYTLTEYVTRHSSDYFHKRFAGAIGGKVGNTSQALKTLVERFLWSQTQLTVALLTTFVLAFYTNYYIGWLFVAWLGVVLPLNVYLARRRVPLSAAAQKEDTHVRARIIDLLTNISAMHDFARRTLELGNIKKYVLLRYRLGIKNWTASEINRIINNVLQTIFIGSITALVVYTWGQGLVTVGDVVLVLSLMGGLGHRMEEMGKELNELAEHYGEVQEGIEDLLNPYDIVDKKDAKPLTVEAGSIEFKDISFEYDDNSRDIFAAFSLKILPGQKVGLVGKSGAGKSTLIKLLLRHHDVKSGAILINEQDISSVTQESVRDAIATVPQEPLLFHRSIRENIAYGKPDATDSEVAEAAKLAQAHEFIERLPQKYATMVGERGVKLSGGERQRIALARAILKPAKILVLDEATSSLDSESEAAIQKALHSLMQGRTVVAVAHRLSTLREMDRLLVLEGGKIIEDGTHAELIKNGGLFSELWSHQSCGYLQDE